MATDEAQSVLKFATNDANTTFDHIGSLVMDLYFQYKEKFRFEILYEPESPVFVFHIACKVDSEELIEFVRKMGELEAYLVDDPL